MAEISFSSRNKRKSLFLFRLCWKNVVILSLSRASGINILFNFILNNVLTIESNCNLPIRMLRSLEDAECVKYAMFFAGPLFPPTHGPVCRLTY